MENKVMRNFERIITAAGLSIKEYGCVDGGIPKPSSLCYAVYNKTGKKEDPSEVTVEYTDKGITSIELVPGFRVDPKVHIIVCDWVGEDESGSNVLGVYYDDTAAKDALKKFVKEERDNFASYDPDDDDYTETLTDTRWEYYETGRYEECHTVIYIASMPLSMM
ncbi:MAG: hypothetical protein IJ341_02770 [Bacteroidales bacterium]|nr:hypothetical protein [Bacteroidales bacterium]